MLLELWDRREERGGGSGQERATDHLPKETDEACLVETAG